MLVGFIYQFYDLTQDYLQYKYLIEFSIKGVNNVIPSVTVCLDQEQRTISRNHPGYHYIKDQHITIEYVMDFNNFTAFSEIDPDVILRYRNNSVCLTYLNDLRNLSKATFVFMVVRSFYYKKADIIFHPANTHSHFYRKTFTTHMGTGSVVDFRKQVIQSLPSPYSTQCFDYSSNALNKVWPKSQTDCKLEYMRRKELEECKHNYHWIESKQKFDNDEQLFNWTMPHSDCLVRPDDEMLSTLCKDECLQTELIEDLSVIGDVNYHEIRAKVPILTIRSYPGYYTHIEYVGQMNLVTYFSSFGGLISMWLGFSVLLMTDIFYGFLNRFLDFIYYSNINQPKSWWKKYTRLIKSIYSIIFALMMSYQLYEITKDYLAYPKSIETSFDEKFTFPKMRIGLQLHGSFIGAKGVAYVNKKIRCQVHFDDIEIDCPRPSIIRRIQIDGRNVLTNLHFLYFHNAFDYNLTHMDHAHNLKYVQIEYSGLESTHSDVVVVINVEFVNYLFNYGHSFPAYKSIKPIDFYKTYNIFIETNNFRRISLENGGKCEDQHKGLFNNYMFDYLVHYCIDKLMNDSFKCLPYHIPQILEPNQDQFEAKYKYCPVRFGLKPDHSLYYEALEKCVKQYKPDCDIQSINVHNTVHDFEERVTFQKTPTEINLIPVSSKMIQFTEKYRFSLNDLFYQIGGTIGVWFGWSVLSLPEFMLVIKHKLSRFYDKIIANEYLFT